MGQHRDDQIGIRIPYKATKIRRRYDRAWRRASIPCIAAVLFAALFSALFAFQYLSHDTDVDWRFAGGDRHVGDGNQIGVVFAALNRSTGIRGLGFGRGSGRDGRDSRYWDRDDRRRDGEYEEEVKERKRGEGSGFGVLYNEAGRDELLKYEEKYRESLGRPDRTTDGDEYDDGIDVDDVPAGGIEDAGRGSDNKRALSEEGSKSKSAASAGGSLRFGNGSKSVEIDGAYSSSGKLAKKSRSKKKSRRHSGSCEMKLLESTSQLLEPLQSKKFSRFSIQYTKSEERPSGVDNWQPRFAGHQNLQERENSFYARDQKMNCGFVNGPKGQLSTGFDLAEDDVKFMSSCHIAVSSCIFGSSDNLRTPYTKTITRSSRKNVCFVMFMDESTLQTLSSEGHQPDSMRFIGLWRIVVVKNLPYNDMRRVGKIPKFLTHRLFPSARYSIWLDSKLRLQRDPVLLLEYFLWRKGHEYAISNHYDRHCVWEEVLQNKKLNKFNHTTIDEQFKFYQAEGLQKFDPSDPNKMLPSHVPEGSFILREHTPMSNLFSCLWFNEVDRFTPRDQLSFAHTYLKLRRMNPEKPFYLNMFKDCERRSIAKLFRHRSESQRTSPQQAVA